MKFLFRRICFYALALWAAVTLNFALPRVMPGNPAEAVYASHYQALRTNPDALHQLAVSLGVSNAPLLTQYWHYLLGILHGDFGISFSYFPVPVSHVIAQSLPWTLGLVGVAAVIAFVLGSAIGAMSAWWRGGLIDTVLPPLAVMVGSFPAFFLALLLLYLLGADAGWLPLGHAYTPGRETGVSWGFFSDVIVHALLPGLTIVLFSLGGWILGMRNTMVNVLAEDYISMAEARGLRERHIVLAYAARNAMLPQLTGLGLSLGFLVGGQVLIEYVFSYPGVGALLANAVGSQDYPLIQALLLTITVSVLAANLLMDLLYAWLDPRTRSAV